MNPIEYIENLKKHDDYNPIEITTLTKGVDKYTKVLQIYHENFQEVPPYNQVKREINFINDKQDGLLTLWNVNGQKEWEDTYKGDKLHGLSSDWDEETGKKTVELNYRNGKLHGLCTGWDDGEKVVEEVYDNGVLLSTKEYLSDEDFDFDGDDNYKDGVYFVQATDSTQIESVFCLWRDRSESFMF